MMSPSQTVRSTESSRKHPESSQSQSRRNNGHHHRNTEPKTTTTSSSVSSRGRHDEQDQNNKQRQSKQLNDYLNANRGFKPPTSPVASWLQEPAREQPGNELRVHLLPPRGEFDMDMDMDMDMEPKGQDWGNLPTFSNLLLESSYAGRTSLPSMGASTLSLEVRSRSYTRSSSSSSSQPDERTSIG
ncbi:hypothetical protein B0T20DRAFT_86096 [Sordaria brevicollis]|uniref:Uncharacterized protein n=1 Tax=Sordaria brevicollis TaxID=83679 RepID=A0AAE0NWF2_SORBR|nr:hypothetical protein B0T20DRAFT_86096 [Sordaria brevicollis]